MKLSALLTRLLNIFKRSRQSSITESSSGGLLGIIEVLCSRECTVYILVYTEGIYVELMYRKNTLARYIYPGDTLDFTLKLAQELCTYRRLLDESQTICRRMCR